MIYVDGCNGFERILVWLNAFVSIYLLILSSTWKRTQLRLVFREGEGFFRVFFFMLGFVRKGFRF